MENHNIKYPCRVKDGDSAQLVVVDGNGAWICQTITGDANADFIAKTLNNALKEDV